MSSTAPQKVVLNSVIYSVSGLLMKGFSLFLLPLYTVHLSTEDYGVTSIAGSFTATMSFIVCLSLFSAIMRFYVDLKDKPQTLKRFYGTVVTFTLMSGVAWFVLLTIFRSPLSKYVFSGVDYYPVILICLVSLIFNIQHTIYTNILKSQQKALKSSVLSIVYFFLTVSLNIYFVVVENMGAVGVLLATLIVDVLFFIYFIWDMVKRGAICFCLDFPLLREALKYSIPIIPHNLSTQITTLISKVLISGSTSMATLGVYSVSTQFGYIADTIQTYVNSAYAPWLYEKLHSKEAHYKKTIRETVRLLSSVLGLFLIGIALFAQDFILLFLNVEYVDAWKYVPLIVMVFAIKNMYYFYVNVLFYYKQASRLLFISTLSSSLINVGLSAVLVPQHGAYGSILADGVAMLVRVAIIVSISMRYENIGLHIRDFVLVFFMVTGFIIVAMLPSYLTDASEFSILNFWYKVIVTLIYLLILFLCYRRQITGYLARAVRKIKRGAY